MYYDTYRGRRDPRGRRGRRGGGCLGFLLGFFFKLIALALVLALLAGGVLYLWPVSFLNVEPTGVSLSLTDGLPAGRVNILLLGLDFLNDGLQRSDTMIVASIGGGSVKLTSILRDTMVEIPGHGRQKLNAAYGYGGAELSMRLINETFGLNITNYIAVDFSTLVDLVDAVGGVDLEVSDKDLEQLNKYAKNTYTKISSQNAVKYARYAASEPISQTGTLHLNGLFATSYARMRKQDSDYMRSHRQRQVIAAIFKALRGNIWKVSMYSALVAVYNDSVRTNLKLVELISLGEKALIAGEIETLRVPQDAYCSDDGSQIELTNAIGCAAELRRFIYDESSPEAS